MTDQQIRQPSALQLLNKILRILRWTKSSAVLLGLFFATIALIIYVWWPLGEELLKQLDWNGRWWLQLDYLLLGVFAVMTILIVSGADIRRDVLIVFVGMCGGLVIESWGTQTHIWNYYTLERPPLWIIPAWPIASLSIDRIVRVLDVVISRRHDRVVNVIFATVFSAFAVIMMVFVAPTIDRPMTIAALALCATLILLPVDRRLTLLHFAAGTGLGYFLEVWGTTRGCWTYYTFETPPLFAVMAHGMAAVAFWRVGLLVPTMLMDIRNRTLSKKAVMSQEASLEG